MATEVSLLPPKKDHRLLVACMQTFCFYKEMSSRRVRVVANKKKKKEKKKKKKKKKKKRKRKWKRRGSLVQVTLRAASRTWHMAGTRSGE